MPKYTDEEGWQDGLHRALKRLQTDLEAETAKLDEDVVWDDHPLIEVEGEVVATLDTIHSFDENLRDALPRVKLSMMKTKLVVDMYDQELEIMTGVSKKVHWEKLESMQGWKELVGLVEEYKEWCASGKPSASTSASDN